MPVNWKDPDAYCRLLAAVIAANEMKPLDYRRIACYFGNGATYDSIEGQFRKFKKQAQVLFDEVKSGQRPEVPIRGSSKKNGDGISSTTSTPRKNKTSATTTPNGKDKVITGRIGKNQAQGSSPSKTPRTTTTSSDIVSPHAIKMEALADGEDPFTTMHQSMNGDNGAGSNDSFLPATYRSWDSGHGGSGTAGQMSVHDEFMSPSVVQFAGHDQFGGVAV